jgi:hypothetical protein
LANRRLLVATANLSSFQCLYFFSFFFFFTLKPLSDEAAERTHLEEAEQQTKSTNPGLDQPVGA